VIALSSLIPTLAEANQCKETLAQILDRFGIENEVPKVYDHSMIDKTRAKLDLGNKLTGAELQKEADKIKFDLDAMRSIYPEDHRDVRRIKKQWEKAQSHADLPEGKFYDRGGKKYTDQLDALCPDTKIKRDCVSFNYFRHYYEGDSSKKPSTLPVLSTTVQKYSSGKYPVSVYRTQNGRVVGVEVHTSKGSSYKIKLGQDCKLDDKMRVDLLYPHKGDTAGMSMSLSNKLCESRKELKAQAKRLDGSKEAAKAFNTYAESQDSGIPVSSTLPDFWMDSINQSCDAAYGAGFNSSESPETQVSPSDAKSDK